MKHYLIAAILGLYSLWLGCAKDEFRSTPTVGGETAPTQIPPNTFTTDSGTSCVGGDKLNLIWVGAAKECIVDRGLTYNFDSGVCLSIRQTTWACNWATVQSEMGKLGLSSSVLNASAARGDKLVSCGQADNTERNRIVVQWVQLPAVGFTCESLTTTPPHITTGCYTRYNNGLLPPPPANEAEKAKQVYACLHDV